MSDFLDRLAQQDAPESREVTIDGRTGTVWFRRISAAEREQLLKGVRINHALGSSGSIDIDLADNERQQQMLVFFSVCNEDGSRYFKKIDQVRNLAHYKLKVLVEHATDVNSEGEEPGKD